MDSFVRRLKTHSQKCKFPPEYVNDHLINQFIGVVHDSVRKTILDKDPSKVTLDDCIQYACTHEATDRQLHFFQGQDQHMVPGIHKTNKRQHPRQQTKMGPCIFCGGLAHKQDNINAIIVTKLDTGKMHVFRNNAQRIKAPSKNPLADTNRNRKFMNYTEKNLVMTPNSTR